jgi:hypothetical protein
MAACKQEPLRVPPPEAVVPNMSGLAPHRMASCPSAVPGSITRIEPTPDGIDVTVTAQDRDAERRIAALAELHRHPGAPALFGPMHTGMRTGSSRIGYCPILHRGTTITTTVVPGGVRIHLQAAWPWRVKELQDLVAERASRLPGFASS